MGAGLDDNTQCDCQAGRPVLRREAVGGEELGESMGFTEAQYQVKTYRER